MIKPIKAQLENHAYNSKESIINLFVRIAKSNIIAKHETDIAKFEERKCISNKN